MAGEKVLFPGRVLTLSGYQVTVYPMGARHVKRFSSNVLSVLGAINAFGKKAGETTEAYSGRIVSELVPFALRHFLEIIGECTVMPEGTKFDDVPQWDLPPIAAAWIEESFGEEKKWRPWVTLVEGAAARFTGKKRSISEIFSSVSSYAATRSRTSSGPSSQSSPTAATASPSSASGPSAPTPS